MTLTIKITNTNTAHYRGVATVKDGDKIIETHTIEPEDSVDVTLWDDRSVEVKESAIKE